MKNNFIFKIIEKDIINNNNLKIKTRFSPEPNGFLHIGHIKSIFLNSYISKKYNGEFILRIDDTNPVTSSKYFVNNIIKDFKWLNIKYNNIQYSSNYFLEIYNFSIYLIKKKLAYIDSFNVNEIRNNRGNFYKLGENSIYRNRNIEENLYLFNKMKNGYYNENILCLRLKINMKSNFIILRDPIIYRIKLSKHYKTNNDWCIYPTYDFSHCICDYLDKISHSICTLEFIENKIIYNFVLNNINIDKSILPKQYEFSKFNMEFNILSKRKINKLIKYNKINKYNDKRLFTISGIRNRGYYNKSIKNIFNKIDINKNNTILKLYEFNNYIRNDIDDKSFRLISIFNPIKIIIFNLRNKKNINIPNNPLNIKYGYRKYLFNKHIYIDYIDFIKYFYNFENNVVLKNIIKLKYSYIIKPIKVIFNFKNKIFVFCKYYYNSINTLYILNNKVNCIIHWISCKNVIKAKVNIYNNLFYLNNICNVKKYINKFNNNSIYTLYIYIENNKKIINNKIYQLERIGYFRIIKKKKILILDLIHKLKNNKFI